MKLDQFFDVAFVISLERRSDRYLRCVELFSNFGNLPVVKFSAYDFPNDPCFGCVASHRAVLDIIRHDRIRSALILEDDFEILHDDFTERFDRMSDQVSSDWDLLYLGGQYAAKPLERVSEHVIRPSLMLTTSSYGVTCKMAGEIAPRLQGSTPVDLQFYQFHRSHNIYCFEPRLMVQRVDYSDIAKQVTDHRTAMLDETFLRNL